MLKKVVIFGLAGNPIHVGHTAIAKELTKHCDEVWLSPCYSHMHNKEMASPTDRLEMCRLAVAEIKNVKVSPIEINHQWARSSYEFLCQLRETFDDTDFSFCIGQDNADAIEKWKFYDKLIAEFPFIVVPRNGWTPENVVNERWYDRKPHLFLEDFKTYNISSTLIRKSPKTMQDALHPKVSRYIKKHHLYEIHD